MTIIPPDPIMEPALVSSSKPTSKSNRVLRDTSSGRPPGLHGLELFASGDAAADLEDNISQGHAHGYFHQAGIGYLADQGKNLRALAALRFRICANQSAPLLMIRGTLAHVSTLFRTLGLSQRPLTSERIYFRSGLSRPPFQGRHQGGGFAADESAGPLVHLNREIKARTEDILPKKPYSSACRMAMVTFSTARGYSCRT